MWKSPPQHFTGILSMTDSAVMVLSQTSRPGFHQDTPPSYVLSASNHSSMMDHNKLFSVDLHVICILMVTHVVPMDDALQRCGVHINDDRS